MRGKDTRQFEANCRPLIKVAMWGGFEVITAWQ